MYSLDLTIGIPLVRKREETMNSETTGRVETLSTPGTTGYSSTF